MITKKEDFNLKESLEKSYEETNSKATFLHKIIEQYLIKSEESIKIFKVYSTL